MNERTLFKPCAAKKKFAYVAEQILEKVREGVLIPGDRLPSEEEIARQIGVSRSSVREALSALQVVGVIERRPGDGTYIRSSASNQIRRALSLLKESESPLEIWEAREGVELWVSQLVIERLSLSSLEDLKNCFERMRNGAKISIEEYLKENKAFHMCLAELAANSILRRIVETLVELSHRHLLKELSMAYSTSYMDESIKKHAEILAAIESKDAVRAANAIREHFRKLRMFIEGGEKH